MAIVVPAPHDEMMAETFGAPVATLLNTLTPTAWVGFPYNANAADLANNQPLQYRRAGDLVQMRGTFQVTASLAAASEVAFGILPVGFRPPLAVIAFGLCGWTQEAVCRFNISNTGQWSVKPSIALTAGQNFITVGGITQHST